MTFSLSLDTLERLYELGRTCGASLNAASEEVIAFCEHGAYESEIAETAMRARKFSTLCKCIHETVTAARSGSLRNDELEIRVKILEEAAQETSDKEMAELCVLALKSGRWDLVRGAHKKSKKVCEAQTYKEFYQRKESFMSFAQNAKFAMKLFVRQKNTRCIQRAVVVTAPFRLSARVCASARAYRSHRRRSDLKPTGTDGGDPDSSSPPPKRSHSVK